MRSKSASTSQTSSTLAATENSAATENVAPSLSTWTAMSEAAGGAEQASADAASNATAAMQDKTGFGMAPRGVGRVPDRRSGRGDLKRKDRWRQRLIVGDSSRPEARDYAR